MQEKQKQNLKGNFASTRLVKVGGFVVITLAVAATAFILSKKDKKQIASSSVTVPTTQVSELPAWWLSDNFGASTCSQDSCKSDADPDGDGLTNAQEYYYHSNPLLSDTNKNGLSDGEDVANDFDPSKPGKVTFEQAASSDSVLGEGLVFDKDIKQMISEELSPDKIKIPEPDPSLIKISNDGSVQSIKDYTQKATAIIDKYFPDGYDSSIQAAVDHQDPKLLMDLENKSSDAVQDLSQLSVPEPAVQMQKYTIALFQLLPSVANMPSQDEINDEYNQKGNAWYDQAQSFMLLVQKMQQEQDKLNKLG